MEASIGASQGQGGSIHVGATLSHHKAAKALAFLLRHDDSEGAISMGI